MTRTHGAARARSHSTDHTDAAPALSPAARWAATGDGASPSGTTPSSESAVAAFGDAIGAGITTAVTAPTDPAALVRFARTVHGHLHDEPGTLIPYARSLDRQLLAGAFDARPADVIAVVEALLAIRAGLAARRPVELAEFRTTSSPLDGMIEDIAPFGNVDMWHAARAAARVRAETERRPTPPPATEGGGIVPPADPTITVPPPEHTIGEHAGSVSADHAGRGIADDLDDGYDGSAGRASAAIDAIGMTYDGIDALVGGIGGFFGEVIAPAIAPLLQTIGLFLTMEDAWRATAEGRAAAGMRMAVVELDHPWSPYPDVLATAALEARVAATEMYRMEISSAGYEAGDPGENARLIRAGIARVASAVNSAVSRGEAWPAVHNAIVEASPDLAARIRQDLRANVYHRIVAAVRERMGTP